MQYTKKSPWQFTFIDLFAGIGGFHIAFKRLGGRCVYANEWNEYARKTYEYNFRRDEPDMFEKGMYTGDITLKENQDLIPHGFDLL